MKQRNGFVSNSSSSAFILAIDNQEVCKCCGRNDIDILQLVRDCMRYDDGETKIVTTDTQELIDRINEDEWRDKEKLIRIIKKAKDQGKTIAYVYVAYSNKTLSIIINNANNVEILDNRS